MKRFLNWLSENPKSNILIISLYFLLVVLPHELVGKIVVTIFKNSTRTFYQNTVLVFGSIILSSLIYFFYLNFKKLKDRRNLFFYLMFTVFLMVVSFNILIIHNIEIIHFAQYFGLALLLFPVMNNSAKTLYWCTLAGAIDEAYQYFFLAPDNTNYFDFNDVILNQLGAALGIVMILSMGYTQVYHKFIWYKNIELLITLIFALGILILSSLNLFSVYPPQNGASPIILLVKKMEPGFWTNVIHLKAKFHVVRPLEGIIIIALLWFFYSFIDVLPLKNKRSN